MGQKVLLSHQWGKSCSTMGMIRKSQRSSEKVMTGKCMVQQVGVERNLVPSHHKLWWYGLLLEKDDVHHKPLGIKCLYSSYSWANGLAFLQLLQTSTKTQCDPSRLSKMLFQSRVTREIRISWGKPQSLLLRALFIDMQAYTSWPAVKTELQIMGWQ